MRLKAIALDAFMVACRLFIGIKKNKVIFISFGGKSYSDNPKKISEELHRIAPNLEIVWLFRNPNLKKEIIPEYIRMVDYSNIMHQFREMATCSVMVNNFCFPKVKKSKHQFFIQTWHGDRAFKKVLYDSPFVSKDYSIAEAVSGFCDLAVAGSDYGERQYRSAFHYTGEVLKEGTPRDDVLVEQSQCRIEIIRRQIGISADTRLLLYAPTLRRKNQMDGSLQEIQEIDIYKTLDTLEKKYNEKWACLMRAHPAVSNLSGYIGGERIIDVTKYEDMADLLLISDMLITDYSSSAGDYALLGRPLVLFQSDISEYLKQDRTFYFEMDESPFYIAHNQAELETIINAFDETEIMRNCKEILEFYGTNETGKSSHAVAERICKFIKEQGGLK